MAMNASSPNPPAAAPWSQIVASTAAAAVPHSSPSPPPPSAVIDTSSVTEAAEDLDNNSGGNSGKRPVWSKPFNAAASSVMGAESWPALSESAKAPAKSPPPPLSPPQELMKPSLDSSTLPQLQGTGSMLPSPQRQVKDTAGVNNVTPGPIHQKPYRRSNSNVSLNGGHRPQMSAPQGFIAVPPGSHNHNSAPMDHLPRAGFVPNDQPQRRNSFRNRNGGGLHPRGDGSQHHNYGSRRDQDRGNQDWNTHTRNFNGRNNYRSPRFVPQFVRPPPPANHAQYYPPPTPPIPPFVESYGYHEVPPQLVYGPPLPMEPLRSVPFVQPIPLNAIFYPPSDPELHTKIVNQIDYYFSDVNLNNDTYLKRNMDDQGWVPLNLIAGFNKVKLLTDNIQIVLDAVRTSSVVEVKGDKIRRRNWIALSTRLSNVGQLAGKVQSIALETTTCDATGGLHVSRSRSSADSNS